MARWWFKSRSYFGGRSFAETRFDVGEHATKNLNRRSDRQKYDPGNSKTFQEQLATEISISKCINEVQ